MKTWKLLPVGFLAVALATTGALVATAQTAPVAPEQSAAQNPLQRTGFRGDREDRSDGFRADHRRHGGGFGGRGGEMLRTLFGAVDADADGSITQQEIDAYRAGRLAELDASGDGALSIEEFDMLYRELTRVRMVDSFQELDADGDGVIVTAEMDVPVAQLVARLDRDGDGVLTLQRPVRGTGN